MNSLMEVGREYVREEIRMDKRSYPTQSKEWEKRKIILIFWLLVCELAGWPHCCRNRKIWQKKKKKEERER